MEAKSNFIHHKDFIFLTFAMKGYSKLTDIRYALSENELVVELKDPATRKVHRLCKTLQREVDVGGSSIQLLVDYVAVKMKKKEDAVTWDALGYDIKEFTVPKNGVMNSNFIARPIVKIEPPPVVSEKENANTSNLEQA